MDILGQGILYIIMACSVIGCIASIINRRSGLGKAYLDGFYTIGHIFVAIAGIFASIPYIVYIIEHLLAPLYNVAHLEPSLSITSILAIDMGGYQIIMQTAKSLEGATMAMFVGCMAGATIVFSIPVGLRIFPLRLHRDFALGIMIGFLGIPIGVCISCIIVFIMPIAIRSDISTQSDALYHLSFSWKFIAWNLIPLVIFSLSISLGLYYAREMMIKIFYVFGFCVDAWCKIFLSLLLIEHFSGGVSKIFGTFPFDPVFADSVDTTRALEVAGYTGLVLSGTFVMCFLFYRFLESKYCPRFDAGLLGSMLACASNVLAGYPMLLRLASKTRIQVIAFSVCGGFLIGDHLSFIANFQPNLIAPIMLGKLAGGLFALYIARLFIKT